MTKFLCIKDCHVDDLILFKKGNFYESEAVLPLKQDYILIRSEVQPYKYGYEVNFYLNEKIQEWNKFSDYFITLAEWREEQINSILDE